MQHTSTRRKTNRGRKLPLHWWQAKDEDQEARWWDANFERLLDEAIRKGTLQMASVEEILRQAKRRLRPERQPTKQLTLRIPVEVIEAAKTQAARSHVPYQTLMRSVLTKHFTAGR
jgi:predicted DNA binding CopG/RHH family protein